MSRLTKTTYVVPGFQRIFLLSGGEYEKNTRVWKKPRRIWFFQHCNFVMRMKNSSLEYFRWSMRLLYSGPNFARRRGLLENHRPIAISFTSCFLPYGASGRGEFWLRVTNIKPESPSMTLPLSYSLSNSGFWLSNSVSLGFLETTSHYWYEFYLDPRPEWLYPPYMDQAKSIGAMSKNKNVRECGEKQGSSRKGTLFLWNVF